VPEETDDYLRLEDGGTLDLDLQGDHHLKADNYQIHL